MSEHNANISWKRNTEDFKYKTYSRNHLWNFNCGLQVEASAAPDFLGDDKMLDPEEAFVASISSCHMLTFLAIAAKKGIIVDEYNDNATGFLEKSDGKMAVTRVELNPKISFGKDVSPEELESLHEEAHKHCFIANSIQTTVVVKN